MSSLLLLSAIGEGVASFVLPIIDAFGPPKYVEHKFYFEVGRRNTLAHYKEFYASYLHSSLCLLE